MRAITFSTILFSAFLLIPAVTAASPETGWMEPQLGSFDPAHLQLVRAQAEADRANGTNVDFENTEQMAREAAEYEERRASGGLRRGGVNDDDATHYARGNTLIMHVFINHGGGTWSQTERDVAAAKAYAAKDYYINDTDDADLANVHFDHEGTTTYWYINPTLPYTIPADSTFNSVDMNAALALAGVADSDGDGMPSEPATSTSRTDAATRPSTAEPARASISMRSTTT